MRAHLRISLCNLADVVECQGWMDGVAVAVGGGWMAEPLYVSLAEHGPDSRSKQLLFWGPHNHYPLFNQRHNIHGKHQTSTEAAVAAVDGAIKAALPIFLHFFCNVFSFSVFFFKPQT